MDRELDPDICGWIVEFLVCKSVDEMLVKKLIQALPFNFKPRMKKAVLLRCIENKISTGEISEKILDLLEMIERIDCNQRLPNSMKEAYCAVALDCTAKYLAGGYSQCSGLYTDAVESIWRGRIENLEKSKASNLVSEQLRRRRRQVEAAFGDEAVVRWLVAMNTRNKAIFSLKLYLREALGSMGPPFLESVCLEPRPVQLAVAREVEESSSS